MVTFAGSLPKLPGYTAKNPMSKGMHHHRPSVLDYKNGEPFWRARATPLDHRLGPADRENGTQSALGFIESRRMGPESALNTVSGNPRSLSSLGFHQGIQQSGLGGGARDAHQRSRNAQPGVQYSSPDRHKTPIPMLPTQRCVRFKAFLVEEMSSDCSIDGHRVHEFAVTCYLDDDTFVVKEFGQPNSGMWQGVVLKRSKCIGDDGHAVRWRDLRVGSSIVLAGRRYNLVDCDIRSRNFYKQVCGVTQGEALDIPKDPFQMRLIEERRKEKDFYEAKEKAAKRGQESADEQKARFMMYDRQVCRFYCFWDDDRFMKIVRRKFALLYYLVDGTIEMIEQPRYNLTKPTMFLSRRLIAADDKQQGPREISQAAPSNYISADMLMIGKTVTIFNKPFFIFDCDPFTKDFYSLNMGYGDAFPDPINVDVSEEEQPRPETPPHNGFGSFEDSLRNTKNVMPKVPLRDARRYIDLNSRPIRFKCTWLNAEGDDVGRTFVLTFYSIDSTLSIFETTQLEHRNTGIMGGKCLDRVKVVKPGCEDPVHPVYYTLEDFYEGAEVNVFGRLLRLEATDEQSKKNIQAIKDYPKLPAKYC